MNVKWLQAESRTRVAHASPSSLPSVMDLTRSLPWYAASVRAICVLRIEESNDLRPAVEEVLRQQEQS